MTLDSFKEVAYSS